MCTMLSNIVPPSMIGALMFGPETLDPDSIRFQFKSMW